MALDSMSAAPVIPPPPKAATSTFKAPSHVSSGTSQHSSAGESHRASSDPAERSGNAPGKSARAPGHGAAPKGSSRASGNAGSRSANQAGTNSTAQSSGGAQAAGAATNGAKGGAAKPGNGAESNFLQALADSQAAAATDASAAAPVVAADVEDDRSKADKDADADGAADALALSQSLAAALAGQAANPVQNGSATAGQSDSASGISLTSGSSTQAVLAMLTKDTGGDGKSADADTAAAQMAPGPDKVQDGGSTSAAAIQAAHLGAGAHFGIQHTGANADPTTADLRSTVGTAAFHDELGGKLTWMAHRGVETGSLQLSPEHLGPLEVRIQVQNGAASVWFGAHHAETRAALEQALPHLRQMFANQGLTLSDAGVSRESPRGQPQKTASSSSVAAVGAVGSERQSVVSLSGRRSGLLDTYA